MNAIEAYADLRRMGKAVLTTEEAALRLRVSVPATTMTLCRLQGVGLVQRLVRGLWAVDPDLDPLVVPEYLTAPFPAYVSLQSALYLHGMIGQIPQVIYVASMGPTRRIRSSKGTYSIHRFAPEFFGGYRTAEETGIRMATPEKALLDVLYLANARSRRFARLPELTLPRRFDRLECARWIDRIRDPLRRTMVRTRLSAILRSPAPERPRPRGRKP